jgi:hypothetical protein
MDRSAIGRRSVRKGKVFERWVAKRLREYFPEARRGLSQSRNGHEECDISNTPWRIEVKVGGPAKRPADALAQCERDAATAGDKRPCVAICRVDRGQPMAYMRLGSVDETCRSERWGIVISMRFEDWMDIARRF